MVLGVVVTTPDLKQALTPQPDVTVGPAQSGAIAGIDDTKSYQSIDGFGAAMTDSSTYLLGTQLSAQAQAQVMTGLFSRTGGIGLSLMRIPMGSSDNTATPISAPAPYSYDDNGGVADPTLANFSISHDLAYTIPVLLAAENINPEIKFFANPWSPPAWMKTDNSMYGVANGVTGQLLSNDYPVLAQYFVDFIEAYQAKGIPLWAITPQNEPSNQVPTYPGMYFPASQEATFVGSYLKPALAAAGLSTRILGGDDVSVNVGYAKTILQDSLAGPALYGTAWHCYANDLWNLGAIAAVSPQQPVYMTECSTGPTGIAPLNATQTILEATHFSASGAVLWNVALDPSGGPKIGQGCNGCTALVTVDEATQTAQFTIDYYELGQFSKFVQPGATHVQEIGGNNGIWDQAYRNPDGSEVLVLYNTFNSSQTFTVQWNQSGSFSYTLAAGATATFISGPVLPTDSAVRSLQLAAQPGMVIRHYGFAAWLDPIGPSHSTLGRDDASFYIRSGHAASNCYSFESKNYPGYFLRHQYFRLDLQPSDQSALYAADTTFCAIPGLSGTGFSLEPINYPDHVIHVRSDDDVWIDVPDGSASFAKASSFNFTEQYLPTDGKQHALALTSAPNLLVRHQNFLGYVSPISNASAAGPIADASFTIVPGNANPACYSLEASNYPGYYLRHYDFRLQLNKSDGSALFNSDSTFCLASGLAGAGISLASYNYPSMFLDTHADSGLYLDTNDKTTRFAASATFDLDPAP